MCAGETEEQYLATEVLVRSIGFDRVNTAAYSPRPNTPAAEWDNQVRPGRATTAGLRLAPLQHMSCARVKYDSTAVVAIALDNVSHGCVDHVSQDYGLQGCVHTV